eukprot:GHVH01002912.1.p1 GENE.GHVH01002912.1~~GHVH01002912.1.p1  ORF type:complete len:2144 (-),score=312.66 GHVH01002912.1:225-6656(-)
MAHVGRLCSDDLEDSGSLTFRGEEEEESKVELGRTSVFSFVQNYLFQTLLLFTSCVLLSILRMFQGIKFTYRYMISKASRGHTSWNVRNCISCLYAINTVYTRKRKGTKSAKRYQNIKQRQSSKISLWTSFIILTSLSLSLSTTVTAFVLYSRPLLAISEPVRPEDGSCCLKADPPPTLDDLFSSSSSAFRYTLRTLNLPSLGEYCSRVYFLSGQITEEVLADTKKALCAGEDEDIPWNPLLSFLFLPNGNLVKSAMPHTTESDYCGTPQQSTTITKRESCKEESCKEESCKEESCKEERCEDSFVSSGRCDPKSTPKSDPSLSWSASDTLSRWASAINSQLIPISLLSIGPPPLTLTCDVVSAALSWLSMDPECNTKIMFVSPTASTSESRGGDCGRPLNSLQSPEGITSMVVILSALCMALCVMRGDKTSPEGAMEHVENMIGWKTTNSDPIDIKSSLSDKILDKSMKVYSRDMFRPTGPLDLPTDTLWNSVYAPHLTMLHRALSLSPGISKFHMSAPMVVDRNRNYMIAIKPVPWRITKALLAGAPVLFGDSEMTPETESGKATRLTKNYVYRSNLADALIPSVSLLSQKLSMKKLTEDDKQRLLLSRGDLVRATCMKHKLRSRASLPQVEDECRPPPTSNCTCNLMESLPLTIEFYHVQSRGQSDELHGSRSKKASGYHAPFGFSGGSSFHALGPQGFFDSCGDQMRLHSGDSECRLLADSRDLECAKKMYYGGGGEQKPKLYLEFGYDGKSLKKKGLSVWGDVILVMRWALPVPTVGSDAEDLSYFNQRMYQALNGRGFKAGLKTTNESVGVVDPLSNSTPLGSHRHERRSTRAGDIAEVLGRRMGDFAKALPTLRKMKKSKTVRLDAAAVSRVPPVNQHRSCKSTAGATVRRAASLRSGSSPREPVNVAASQDGQPLCQDSTCPQWSSEYCIIPFNTTWLSAARDESSTAAATECPVVPESSKKITFTKKEMYCSSLMKQILDDEFSISLTMDVGGELTPLPASGRLDRSASDKPSGARRDSSGLCSVASDEVPLSARSANPRRYSAVSSQTGGATRSTHNRNKSNFWKMTKELTAAGEHALQTVVERIPLTVRGSAGSSKSIGLLPFDRHVMEDPFTSHRLPTGSLRRLDPSRSESYQRDDVAFLPNFSEENLKPRWLDYGLLSLSKLHPIIPDADQAKNLLACLYAVEDINLALKISNNSHWTALQFLCQLANWRKDHLQGVEGSSDELNPPPLFDQMQLDFDMPDLITSGNSEKLSRSISSAEFQLPMGGGIRTPNQLFYWHGQYTYESHGPGLPPGPPPRWRVTPHKRDSFKMHPLGRGCPPGPPPPTREEFMLMSRKGNSDNGIAPLGKKIYWKPIKDEKNTIFNQIATLEKDLDLLLEGSGIGEQEGMLDVSHLQDVFVKSDRPVSQRTHRSDGGRDVDNNIVEVFDAKRCQNLNIILARIPSPELLIQYLSILWYNPFGKTQPDIWQKFNGILLTDSERDTLRKELQDGKVLRRIPEQKLKCLSGSEPWAVRVALLNARWDLQHKLNHVQRGIDLIHKGISEIKTSSKFKQTLSVILRWGNFINHGAVRSSERKTVGFTLESLIKLADFRSPNDLSITSLHYLAVQMLSPPLVSLRLDELYDELPSVKMCNKFTSDSLNGDAKSLMESWDILLAAEEEIDSIPTRFDETEFSEDDFRLLREQIAWRPVESSTKPEGLSEGSSPTTATESSPAYSLSSPESSSATPNFKTLSLGGSYGSFPRISVSRAATLLSSFPFTKTVEVADDVPEILSDEEEDPPRISSDLEIAMPASVSLESDVMRIEVTSQSSGNLSDPVAIQRDANGRTLIEAHQIQWKQWMKQNIETISRLHKDVLNIPDEVKATAKFFGSEEAGKDDFKVEYFFRTLIEFLDKFTSVLTACKENPHKYVELVKNETSRQGFLDRWASPGGTHKISPKITLVNSARERPSAAPIKLISGLDLAKKLNKENSEPSSLITAEQTQENCKDDGIIQHGATARQCSFAAVLSEKNNDKPPLEGSAISDAPARVVTSSSIGKNSDRNPLIYRTPVEGNVGHLRRNTQVSVAARRVHSHMERMAVSADDDTLFAATPKDLVTVGHGPQLSSDSPKQRRRAVVKQSTGGVREDLTEEEKC